MTATSQRLGKSRGDDRLHRPDVVWPEQPFRRQANCSPDVEIFLLTNRRVHLKEQGTKNPEMGQDLANAVSAGAEDGKDGITDAAFQRASGKGPAAIMISAADYINITSTRDCRFRATFAGGCGRKPVDAGAIFAHDQRLVA